MSINFSREIGSVNGKKEKKEKVLNYFVKWGNIFQSDNHPQNVNCFISWIFFFKSDVSWLAIKIL